MPTSKDIQLYQTRNIKNYKLVLEGLVADWGHIYWDAILQWCGIIFCAKDGKYWQVWAIKYKGKTVGICGLFAHNKSKNPKELWLGWFGLHPKFRSKKIGVYALSWMENYAKTLGCKRILSYVDKDGGPLPFYYRNGYKRMCSVKQYLQNNTRAKKSDFEDLADHVIYKDI